MTDEPVRCGCGGEAKVYETPLKDCEGYFIQCNDCRTATFIWLSEAEAITAWNRAMIAKDINVPDKERKIIRCADCKWWDRLEEGHPYGYCLACRSGTHTERWDISIYRQCKFDFYCADAEPRNDEEKEGEQ